MKILEKVLEMTEFKAIGPDDLKWYHIIFFSRYYDEDTDTMYLAGLNIVPIMLLCMILFTIQMMMLL